MLAEAPFDLDGSMESIVFVEEEEEYLGEVKLSQQRPAHLLA